MKFFKPEDFILPKENEFGKLEHSILSIAQIANAKLERGGIELFCESEFDRYDWSGRKDVREKAKYKAFLINIEPINKCEHPKEKITEVRTGMEGGLIVGKIENGMPWPGKTELLYGARYYQCECGVQVEPESFKEMR